MPAHIVSTVVIHDPAKFQAYAAAINGLAQQFGGTYVVRGTVLEGLEGNVAVGERIVVIQFPDAQSARNFYHSQQYQDARKLRAGGVDVTMRLLEA